MDISLVQLRMLREVARRGTLAAAADALGYSPSALSQQLTNLDRAVGTELLERIGRNVRFTDAGRSLAAHAVEILDGVDAAKADIEAAKGEATGDVHVAVFESIASNLLTGLLERLEYEYPALTLRSRLSGPSGAIDELTTGDVDLAFTIDYDMAPVPPVAGVSREDVFEDRFFLVVPAASELSLGAPRGVAVPLSSAAGLAFIGPDLDSSCGAMIEMACGRAGFRPDMVHCLEDYRTAIEMVAGGHGVSLIPDLGLPCAPLDERVRILCLEEVVSRRIQLAFRTASAQRPAITAVRTALADLMQQQRYAA